MTLFDLLFILGGLALLAVAAEFAARAWIRSRGQYSILRAHTTTLMRVDRETLPQLEPEVRVAINRDGERGPDPPKRWDGTYRVLVAGGSAAECYLLDQESSWPHVVQTELQARAADLGVKRVHVGNVSRSLVACEYIEEMLRKVLPRYKKRLDLVVLMVGASDVVAWLEKKTPDKMEEGRLSTDYVFDEHPEGPFGWTLSTLALRQVISRLHKRLTHPVGVREGAGKTIGRNRAMRARAGELVDEIPDPRPMVEYFEKYFRRTLETAKAAGARVLVVRQPWLRKDFSHEENARLWNFGAGRPYEEEVQTYYSHRVVDELMGAVDASAAKIADELGVEHLDLMSTVDHDFETFYDRLHFTPKGARVVGAAVARKVLGEESAAAGGTANRGAASAAM